MRITIVTPSAANVRTGNRCTADGWSALLRSLGHEVSLVSSWRKGDDCDLLVALHSVKSADSIRRFRASHPGRGLVVVLTGTDLYGEPSAVADRSMALADRIIVLQDRAPDHLAPDLRPKARVIVQSAFPRPGGAARERSLDPFDICVAAHLREVKDPLRAAAAARLLPVASRIRIRHAGGILEEEFRALVEREQRGNPRYTWLGEVPGDQLAALMSGCQATVVSSRLEGGARVAGESIVAGTPVIASRIDGMTGLLGEDYPAYYPYGDTEALAALMWRLESDPGFRAALRERAAALAPRFHPSRERAAWESLLLEFGPGRPAATAGPSRSGAS